MTVSPGTATVLDGASQQFSVSGNDQFGNAMTPNVTWSVSGTGTAHQQHRPVHRPGLRGTPVVIVTATSGGARSNASVTLTDPPPTVATAASANPSTVTGNTTRLSVLGADAGGAANLDLHLDAPRAPPRPRRHLLRQRQQCRPEHHRHVHRGRQLFLPGHHPDSRGLTATSAVTVNVVQTLTGLTVSPATATVLEAPPSSSASAATTSSATP